MFKKDIIALDLPTDVSKILSSVFVQKIRQRIVVLLTNKLSRQDEMCSIMLELFGDKRNNHKTWTNNICIENRRIMKVNSETLIR